MSREHIWNDYVKNTKKDDKDIIAKLEQLLDRKERERERSHRRSSRHHKDDLRDPPEFEGSLSSNAYYEWKRDIERLIEIKEYTDEEAYKLVVHKLKGYASLWFENLKRERVKEHKSKIKTWTKLKKHMDQRFLSKSYKHQSPPRKSPSTRHSSHSSRSSSYRDEEPYARHASHSSHYHEEPSSRSRRAHQVPRPSSPTRASSVGSSNHGEFKRSSQRHYPPEAPTTRSPSMPLQANIEEPLVESQSENSEVEEPLEIQEPIMTSASTPCIPLGAPSQAIMEEEPMMETKEESSLIEEACQLTKEEEPKAESKEEGDQALEAKQALVPIPIRSFKDVLCKALPIQPYAAHGDTSAQPIAQPSQSKTKEQDMGIAAALDTPKPTSDNFRCFKCHGLGHLQDDCPNKRALTLQEIEHFYEVPIEKGMEAEEHEHAKEVSKEDIIISLDMGEFPLLQSLLPHPEPRQHKESFPLVPSTPPPSKKHKGKGSKGKPLDPLACKEEDQRGFLLARAIRPSWRAKRPIDPGITMAYASHA